MLTRRENVKHKREKLAGSGEKKYNTQTEQNLVSRDSYSHLNTRRASNNVFMVANSPTFFECFHGEKIYLDFVVTPRNFTIAKLSIRNPDLHQC